MKEEKSEKIDALIKEIVTPELLEQVDVEKARFVLRKVLLNLDSIAKMVDYSVATVELIEDSKPLIRGVSKDLKDPAATLETLVKVEEIIEGLKEYLDSEYTFKSLREP